MNEMIFKNMFAQNNDIEYCKKCGGPTPVLVSSLVPCGQGHTVRYCGDCGTQYEYHLLDFDKITNTPLYKKFGELHILYFGEHDTRHLDLISRSAKLMIYRLAKYSLPEILKGDFVNDEKQTQQIDAYAEPLMSIYWDIVLDGYFVWIAEQLLSGKKISESKAPKSEAFEVFFEAFEEECHKTSGVIYEDFIQNDKDSQRGNSISKDTSLVLHALVPLQAHGHFNQIKELRELDGIYLNFQATCYQGVVAGYATAMVDARYRE